MFTPKENSGGKPFESFALEIRKKSSWLKSPKIGCRIVIDTALITGKFSRLTLMGEAICKVDDV